MVKITFVAADGRLMVVDAMVGASVMMAALTGGVDDLPAECGGALACGTCHVHVGTPPEGLLPPSAMEEAMLSSLDARRPDSRLSCQLTVTAAFDGLVLHLPPTDG
ncbi:(2Fe-2S)-binding protein [Zavarzinia compransoris]|uniref:2Fe-2S iron-sulfur cluster-binding protein n=1 Tax=Zavarzinia marina TaxID=2911065 RepID=UPI001F176766|nr:2Fe-2S iron-sulfur cluster-binding protein [Zavarzinia marina]MCF4167700.1 (2Fe-2S)-binding protein [Zavarzinia marina]